MTVDDRQRSDPLPSHEGCRFGNRGTRSESDNVSRHHLFHPNLIRVPERFSRHLLSEAGGIKHRRERVSDIAVCNDTHQGPLGYNWKLVDTMLLEHRPYV